MPSLSLSSSLCLSNEMNMFCIIIMVVLAMVPRFFMMLLLLSLLLLLPLPHQPFIFFFECHLFIYLLLCVVLSSDCAVEHGCAERERVCMNERFRAITKFRAANEVHAKANNVPFSVLNMILMMFLII